MEAHGAVLKRGALLELAAVEVHDVFRERQRAHVEQADGAHIVARRHGLTRIVAAGGEGDVEHTGLEGGHRAHGIVAAAQLLDLAQDAVHFGRDDLAFL